MCIRDRIGTDMVDIVPRMGESDGMLISADRNPNTNGARPVSYTHLVVFPDAEGPASITT